MGYAPALYINEFFPTTISNLERWYDANTLNLADNALVSTWSDLSSNAADLTASGSDRPTYIARYWNGRPALMFYGAQELASTSSTGRPSTDITVFVVAANMKRGSFPEFVSWTGGSTQGWEISGATGVDSDGQPPQLVLRPSGQAWGDINPVTSLRPGRGDPLLITVQRNGTSSYIRIDKGNEVTDSGNSASIDYTTGGGTITLKVGNKGSNIAPLYGVVCEVIIYSRALTNTERDQVEAYLDSKWKLTVSQAKHVGLYNGTIDFDLYKINTCWSPDGKRFKRYLSGPVITTGSGWKSNTVKDPCLLWDGTQYVCYYAAQNASAKYQIGRATSSDLVTWSDYGSNPVISLGTSGAFDDDGCSFPWVEIDTSEPSKKFKLWYAGLKASDSKQRIGYAYSSDGLSFTKVGQVLDVGTSGQWDNIACAPGTVRKIGSTWYMLYQGRKTSAAPYSWQTGIVTFSDPEGSYTKGSSNPILTNLSSISSATQTLSATTSAGSRTVTLPNTVAFVSRQAIALFNGSSTEEDNRVLTIDSGTQLTLEMPVDVSFSSGTAVARPPSYNSIIIRSVNQLENNTWEAWGTAFQVFADLSTSFNREQACRFTASAIDGTWTVDTIAGQIFWLEDTGQFDRFSRENPSIMLTVYSLLIPGAGAITTTGYAPVVS